MLKIADLERKLDELPLLPAVVVRLLALNPNDDDYFEKVLKLAEEDPTFALRLIKVSNSAANAPASPIISLQGAVARLGTKTIAGLVTSMAVMRVFLPSKQGEKNLWIHSVQVALGSKFIAEQAHTLQIDPNQAYLCGLLHDIGRFVLFDQAADDLDLVEQHNWETPDELVRLEREIYGFDHSELGGHVCKKWGLPELVTATIENHHVYELTDHRFKDITFANLILIIQLADFLSAFMMSNSDALSWEQTKLIQEVNDKVIQPACSKPPVSADQLLKLAPRILEEGGSLVSGLGI